MQPNASNSQSTKKTEHGASQVKHLLLSYSEAFERLGAISAEEQDSILELFVSAGISDIILSEGQGVWTLRYGVAEPVKEISANLARALFQGIVERLGEKAAQYEKRVFEGSLDFGSYRFRVSLFRENLGGRMVLRVLSTEIPEPEKINIPPIALTLMTSLRQGLILICGPTGSGKTTTIASVLAARGYLLQEHVITLEDPVEYSMPSDSRSIYSQRQIGRDEPTFAEGLRAALRQAPHLIMIGEVRDPATAATALEASETGHLVIATIHANSADMTVHRYLQMIEPSRQAMAREQLAAYTELVICQRLCRALSGHQGRVALHEVMVKTPATMNCIRKGLWTELRSEIVLGAKKGHITFQQSLHHLHASGRISPLEYENILERLEPGPAYSTHA